MKQARHGRRSQVIVKFPRKFPWECKHPLNHHIYIYYFTNNIYIYNYTMLHMIHYDVFKEHCKVTAPNIRTQVGSQTCSFASLGWWWVCLVTTQQWFVPGWNSPGQLKGGQARLSAAWARLGSGTTSILGKPSNVTFKQVWDCLGYMLNI